MLPLHALTSAIATREPESNSRQSSNTAEGKLIKNIHINSIGKQWITWLGRLYLIIVILCVGTIVYGRSPLTSNHLSLLGLSLCADLPCIQGMKPGQTHWSEAKATLAVVTDSQITENVITLQVERVGRIILTRSMEGAMVKDFYIFVSPESNLTIGDIVQEFGAPCRLGISDYPAGDVVSFYYSSLYIIARNQDQRLTVDMPVSYISYVDPLYRSRPQRDPCKEDFQADLTSQKIRNFSWRGFATFARYKK